MRSLLPLGVLVVFVLACGGNGQSPASPTPSPPTPTPSPPTITGLVIFGPDVVLTGSIEALEARARLSNGSISPVAPAPLSWATDNPGVATIDQNGRLTGQRHGTATITATHEGTSGSFTVRVRSISNSAAGANLAITYRPDPALGSSTPCRGGDQLIPNWTFSLVITETQGVGFTLEVETFSLYNEDGKGLYADSQPADDYFAPNSVLVEEVCTSLARWPSGFISTILEGVDDRGNQLTFAGRLRLLPVAGVSPTSSRIPLAPMAGGTVVRALHRVR